MIERVITHWTAGRHTSTLHERCSYHWLIEHIEGGDPSRLDDDNVRIVQGVPWEQNDRRVYDEHGNARFPCYCSDKSGYGCHARGANSHSVGVALCGMHEAVDHRPDGVVDPGPHPITRMQVQSLINVLNSLRAKFDLEVRSDTIMTHAEADRMQGVTGRRWDPTWIPGKSLGIWEAGDWIRKQVRRRAQNKSIDL